MSVIARTEKHLKTAKAELEHERVESDQQIRAIRADVSNKNQLEDAIKTVSGQSGPPSILITCAGIAHPGYFEKLSMEVFEATMMVNYFGTLYAIKAVVPSMIRRKSGSIILVSSGAGLLGLFGYTAYSASKFAVRGLAEALRGEMKRYNIHVGIVYPPDTDTPQLTQENITKPSETKEITALAKTWDPEDVAQEIIAGIRQQKFAITPGWEMTLLNRLHSPLFKGINWHFDRIAANAEKIPNQP